MNKTDPLHAENVQGDKPVVGNVDGSTAITPVQSDPPMAPMADRDRDQEAQQNRGWGKTKLVRMFAFGLVLSLIGLGGWLITIHFLAEYHLRQAQRAFDRQHYPEALEHLNKANGFRPRSSAIYLRLARVARLLSDFQQADHYLRRYKDLQGQTEEEQLEHLMLRAQTGEVEKVYDQLWGYVELKRPEASIVLQALTYGFLEQQLYNPAEKCLKEWRKIDPDNIQALVCEAWYLDRYGGGTPEARENYIRALELDPSRADIRLRLARAYLNQQNDKKAIEHFKKVFEQQPDNVDAQLGLAQATLSLGKQKEAKAMLRSLLEQHPNDATALREMGMAAMYENDYPEAEKWLRRTLKQSPNDGQAIHNLLECLRRLGHHAAEIVEYERRMKQVSQDMNRLLDLTRNKLMQQPFDPELNYEIGTIYARLGEENQAGVWFARTLKYNPNHQKALKVAVKYLEKMGEKERADELRQRIHEKE